MGDQYNYGNVVIQEKPVRQRAKTVATPLKPEESRGVSPFLVTEKKYIGYHIALPSFNSRKVVAFGKNRSQVRQKAKSQGHIDPLIIFIPPKEEALGL